MNDWPGYANTATTATSPLYWKVRYPVIDTPAHVSIDCLNGTRITGRFVRYSDPRNADALGAFVGEDADGTVHYVLWGAILRISVFPLSAAVPDVPKPEAIK